MTTITEKYSKPFNGVPRIKVWIPITILRRDKQMGKIKSKIKQRQAKKGIILPDKYKNVRDLRWSDSLEREIFQLRSRF